MSILEEAKRIEQDIIADRRHIHHHPELGLELPETVKYVKSRLIEMGYEPKDCGRSGVVVTVGKPGKTFMIRGDMDALPMAECTDVPFKSDNQWMHSCGHDTHTAMMLGAAKLLKEHESELNGTVKLMFQPGEEILAGAKEMIDNGLLENPHVDAAMAIHIASALKKGHLSYSNQYARASADKFVITVNGKGGHGSAPQEGVDPVLVAAYILTALQEITTREISGSAMAVVTVGHIWGGDKENIIPDFAKMEGTIRTYDNSVREFIRKRIPEVADGVAKAFRATATVEYPFGCAPNTNNVPLQEELVGYAKKLIGEENVDLVPGTMGSEDFAWVSQNVPSMFFSLGARVADDSMVYPQHSPHVMFDESAFYIGTATYVTCAMEWLKKNG